MSAGTDSALCAFEISNFKFEIHRGVMLAAIAGVGGRLAGIAHRRPATVDRGNASQGGTTKTGRGLHEKVADGI